jgi:hypothetical protein
MLKELRLANKGTVAAQTAFHATCGTACRSSSGTTAGGSSTDRQGGNGSGSSSGGSGGHGSGYGGGGQGSGGGRWRKKGRGGSHSRGGPRALAPPAGPWYCYAPWTGEAQQQQWHPPATNPACVAPAFFVPSLTPRLTPRSPPPSSSTVQPPLHPRSSTAAGIRPTSLPL